MPVITAIVPTFNDENFIERCLCSVIDQNLDDVQIIVVERGSFDKTRDLVDFYKSEVDQIIDAPGTTLGTAINRALSFAEGRYVTVLKGDCLLMPGAMQTIRQFVARQPQTDWLASANLRIDVDDQLRGEVRPSVPQNLAAYLKHNSGLIPPAGVVWRKALIDEVGVFDDDLDDAYDYDFFSRLLLADHRPTFIGQTLAAVREYEIAQPVEALDTAEQYVHVSRKYGAYLPMTERMALWNNCDLRQRILTVARSEMQGSNSQNYLAWKMLTHPWWISDHHLWQAMFKQTPSASISIDTSAA
ncbi:MAG: glycosyltransferase [Phycisphaeraceae bacterium JB051]